MKLSCVVLTKNEEKNIEKCLKSLQFCDEVIIIDDYSTDSTIEKVKKLEGLKSLRVIKRNLNGNFAAQKNFGMEKAAGDWILFVDADEVVADELKEEIVNKLSMINNQLSTVPACYIKRRDFWWGRELRFGETRKLRNFGLIRLVRKDCGKWVGEVHEVFQVQRQEFKVQSLRGCLNHYPHPTLKDFLEEINFYSTLRAKELLTQGKKTNILEIVFYPLGKFILNYFIYLGFLDGPAGFAYAFLMSFHSFLVRAKLFQYLYID